MSPILRFLKLWAASRDAVPDKIAWMVMLATASISCACARQSLNHLAALTASITSSAMHAAPTLLPLLVAQLYLLTVKCTADRRLFLLSGQPKQLESWKGRELAWQCSRQPFRFTPTHRDDSIYSPFRWQSSHSVIQNGK